jgi:RecB family endonuclease NucS
MASDLTAWRIDVVGDAGTHWDLIEVKDRSSLSAVGQLLGYQILWRRNPPDGRPTRLLFVAPQITPELSIVLAELGIGALIAPT